MSDYDEVLDMNNNTIRDMAAWYLQNESGKIVHVDDDMIDDWIYEVKLTANRAQYKKLCEDYWKAQLSY